LVKASRDSSFRLEVQFDKMDTSNQITIFADDTKNLLEGYLLGDEYGGWGKADLKAMKEHGAVQVIPWKPCSFPEAINRVREHLSSQANSHRII